MVRGTNVPIQSEELRPHAPNDRFVGYTLRQANSKQTDAMHFLIDSIASCPTMPIILVSSSTLRDRALVPPRDLFTP